MKPESLREQTVDELKQQADDLSTELFALRVKKAAGTAGRSIKTRLLRRDIARVKTVLRERELRANG